MQYSWPYQLIVAFEPLPRTFQEVHLEVLLILVACSRSRCDPKSNWWKHYSARDSATGIASLYSDNMFFPSFCLYHFYLMKIKKGPSLFTRNLGWYNYFFSSLGSLADDLLKDVQNSWPRFTDARCSAVDNIKKLRFLQRTTDWLTWVNAGMRFVLAVPAENMSSKVL